MTKLTVCSTTAAVLLAMLALGSDPGYPGRDRPEREKVVDRRWKWLSVKHASAALEARTRALVEKYPELRPAWNIAMQDGVLTWDEAKKIVEAAGEKVEPE